MKATGIVRDMDKLGRIVIPMELRRTMRIQPGDPIEIFTNDDSIVLKKYSNNKVCVICGECVEAEQDKVVEKNGVCVCNRCIGELWLSRGVERNGD